MEGAPIAARGARVLLVVLSTLALTLASGGSAGALAPAADVSAVVSADAGGPGVIESLGASHVPLTRSVEVTSQGHGFLQVRFLQNVRFGATGPSPHATVSFEGGGGFAGLAFVEDNSQNPVALMAGRIDQLLSCARRCVPGSGGVVVRSQGLLRDGEAVSSPHIIPAGLYRMYILSNAGPATVRLNFPDIPGTSEGTQKLLAYTYTGAKVALPDNRAPSNQAALYYAGTSGAIATSGLLFSYVEAIGESHQGGAVYTCEYGATEPQGAYAPYCPGGSADVSDPSANPNAAPFGYRVTRHSFRANVAAGTYGLGGGFLTAGNSIETGTTVAVWLSY